MEGPERTLSGHVKHEVIAQTQSVARLAPKQATRKTAILNIFKFDLLRTACVLRYYLVTVNDPTTTCVYHIFISSKSTVRIREG